jgi:hypothetical protein
MNIFYLDSDPFEAATLQCDRHVVKMILESAQLLSTAHHELGSTAPYKTTHKNHPSAVWVRRSYLHYAWLYKHFIGLCAEYESRYNKTHKSWHTCAEALQNAPTRIAVMPFEEPPQCMPDECKVPGDSVKAYKKYYILKNEEWTKVGRPMTWKQTALESVS